MLCSLLLILAADSLATPARHAVDAMLLFEDGQERLKAGKYGTARLAFHALISVYPESPLVEQAREAMRTAARMEERRERASLVRSIRFENARKVSREEILDRFREREVGIAVEQRCHRRDVDEARSVLAELLAERGVAHPRVKVAVRRHRARSVDVTFHLK